MPRYEILFIVYTVLQLPDLDYFYALQHALGQHLRESFDPLHGLVILVYSL